MRGFLLRVAARSVAGGTEAVEHPLYIAETAVDLQTDLTEHPTEIGNVTFQRYVTPVLDAHLLGQTAQRRLNSCQPGDSCRERHEHRLHLGQSLTDLDGNGVRLATDLGRMLIARFGAGNHVMVAETAVGDPERAVAVHLHVDARPGGSRPIRAGHGEGRLVEIRQRAGRGVVAGAPSPDGHTASLEPPPADRSTLSTGAR